MNRCGKRARTGWRSVSQILSTMSDVRRAFGTQDQATIRDTAGELWSKVDTEDAFFLVSDAQGTVIASLGAPATFVPNDDLPMLRVARAHFPKQASGFVHKGDQLFQVVITPVYVQSAGGSALLDVLVAGYKVDQRVRRGLETIHRRKRICFHVARIRDYLDAGSRTPRPRSCRSCCGIPSAPRVSDYLALPTPLLDVGGTPVGQLFILRSFAGARARLGALRTQILALWLLALIAALAVTYLVARKIMQPVAELDRAAAEIAKQNYDYQINVYSQDELGRLAETFQSMCESIRRPRRN